MAIPKDPYTQDIFDHVALHLLRQGVESGPYGGAYTLRDDAGRSCAIGCLIDEKHLPPESHIGKGIESRVVRRAVASSIGVDTLHRYTIALLTDLQRVHDTVFTGDWRPALNAVAEQHGLDPLP
jgi:hypothetical protein